MLLFLVLVGSVFASWMPLQDYSTLKYVYNKITYFENGEQKEMMYGVTIDRDEDQYVLNYDTTCFLPLETELTADMMFGQQFSMKLFTFLNPMFTFVYDAIDHDEQMNTKLYGFGTLKYEGQHSVQGKNGTYTGTKVSLYNEDGELSMYWIIDPNIPFALETFVGKDYADDSTLIELWNYNTELISALEKGALQGAFFVYNCEAANSIRRVEILVIKPVLFEYSLNAMGKELYSEHQ